MTKVPKVKFKMTKVKSELKLKTKKSLPYVTHLRLLKL
jgi:hypothetical protein